MSLRKLVTAVVVMLCSAGPGAAESTPRGILATGDVVPEFGAVGRGGFDLLGIADDGSVLVAGANSNGDGGVYRVRDGDAVPLWIFGQGAPTLSLEGSDFSPNGRVSIVASQSLYRVDEEGGTRIARAGDRDPGGNTICRFGSSRIDDDGNIAFAARISFDAGCSTPRWGAYLFRDGDLTQILDGTDIVSVDLANAFISVVDLPGDGSVTVRTNGSVVERGLWSWRDGALSPLITESAFDPEGKRRIFAVAATGDVVAFTAGEAARESSLYRHRDGSVTTVLQWGALAPGGQRISSADSLQVNERGDIALQSNAGIFVFPDDGGAYLITAAAGGYINARGDVAVQYWADRIALRSPGKRAVGIKPAGVDAVVTQIASGDAAPDGSRFATGGRGDVYCFGSDGRVGTTVIADDGRTGIACIDAGGPTLVAEGGTSTLDGGSLYEFDQCELNGDGSMLIGASELRPDPTSPRHYYLDWSVFRAGPAGIERIAGPGSTTEEGDTLKGLRSVIVQRERVFAANGDGDVLVYGQAGHGMSLFHVSPGGSIRRLEIAFSGGLGGRGTGWDLPRNPSIVRDTEAPAGGAAGVESTRFTLQDYVLTDDDSVVFMAEYKGASRIIPALGLFLFKDGVLTLIASSDENAALVPAALRSIRYLRARGNSVTFSASNDGKHWYLMTTDDPLPVPILAENGDLGPHLVDHTADGRYLFGQWQSATHLLSGGVIQALYVNGAHGDVLALNERGNLLIGAGNGQLLALDGPPPDTACDFPVPHENEPTVTLTPTITLTPTTTWTRRPTFTPRNTWTPTPSRTPLPPLPCEDEETCPHISAEPASGLAGEHIEVVMTADLAGREIAGLQFDLEIPAVGVLRKTVDGEPDCRVEPELEKDVHFAEHPDCAGGSACTTLRVLVISTTDVDVIDAARLRFVCAVHIVADATPGPSSISVSRVFVSTPGGRKLEARTSDAQLTILNPELPPTEEPPAPTPTAEPPMPPDPPAKPPATEASTSNDSPGQSSAVADGGGGSGGCGIAVEPRTDSGTWLLVLLPAAVLRRRRRQALNNSSR